MYCKKCGTEIADNSVYCSKCGQKQNDSQEFQKKPYEIKTKTDKKSPLWWLCLIIVVPSIISLIIIPIIWNITQEMQEQQKKNEKPSTITPEIYAREIEPYDLDIQLAPDWENLYIAAIFTPKNYINYAKVRFTFFDENRNVLYKIDEIIVAQKEDIQFIRIIHFNEIENKKAAIDYVQYKILEGTVEPEV